MDGDQSIDTVPRAPDRERAFRPSAQAVLREWLRDPSATSASGLGAIGRDAIGRAADAARRLSHDVGVASSAALLCEVESIAAGMGKPQEARRRWLPFGRNDTTPSRDDIGDLVERIEGERDRAIRDSITLTTDRRRLADAGGALEDTVHLIRAARTAVDAAIREIRSEDPSKAHRLGSETDAILTERVRDVLTQLVIVRQATMTVDLLIDNQRVLADALERARTATLSAVQIALAARQARAQNRDLLRQSDTIARIGALTDDAQVNTRHARQMVEDAVAQARRALDAMAPAPRR